MKINDFKNLPYINPEFCVRYCWASVLPNTPVGPMPEDKTASSCRSQSARLFLFGGVQTSFEREERTGQRIRRKLQRCEAAIMLGIGNIWCLHTRPRQLGSQWFRWITNRCYREKAQELEWRWSIQPKSMAQLKTSRPALPVSEAMPGTVMSCHVSG